MRVMVIGSGGREHALVRALAESRGVKKVYCVPGNGGTGSLAQNVDVTVDDHDRILAIARDHAIDKGSGHCRATSHVISLGPARLGCLFDGGSLSRLLFVSQGIADDDSFGTATNSR